MDFTYPEKYFKAASFFNSYIGDLESTTLLDDEQKLILYALKKQAEEGPCTGAAPSFWNSKEFYKYKAWSRLGNISKFEAMVYFVNQLEEILGGPVNWREKMQEAQPQAMNGSTLPKSAADSSAADLLSNRLLSPSDWDKDLSDHAEPTANNIAFMASRVMHTRRLCEQLKELNAKLTRDLQVQKRLEKDTSPLCKERLVEPDIAAKGEIASHFSFSSSNCSQKRTSLQLDDTRQCGLEWLSWI